MPFRRQYVHITAQTLFDVHLDDIAIFLSSAELALPRSH
jgi:hypothetical protein